MKTSFVLPLLLLGASGHGSLVVAQPTGTFTVTGDMLTPRIEHAATLLLDGRVLIAGGFVNGTMFSPTNSAEIYDPSTGTFAATGSMTIPRYLHTAILLPDGRVLIAGGGDGDGRLTLSAEIFDPATGAFTATGSTAAGHWSATLLSNGQVLMEPHPLDSDGAPGEFALPGSPAELYDTSTGTFAATGNYTSTTTAFFGLPCTLLANGKVLAPADSPAEVYDPATGTFSLTGTMVYAHAAVARSATLLTDGKVLFAGGEIDTEYNSGGQLTYPYAELYDPSAGSFTATGNMTEDRVGHTATLLPDGSALITGGGSLPTSQSAEIYDPSTGTFSSLGNMTARRTSHTATLLKDGRVLIVGGYRLGSGPATGASLASAELYTPTVLAPAPMLLSISGDGRGQGAIQHAGTTRIASADDPAVAGEYLSIYLTGLADGGAIPPQIAIGGRLAEVTFFGNVPGYPGLDVINIRMPSGVAPGPAVPVRLTYLGRTSNQVSIGAQ